MGKWEVIYDHGWHVVDVTDKSPGGQILICDCGIDPWSEMNAHKIAAAPELVEALRMVVAANTAEDWSRAVDYARAALAKAGAGDGPQEGEPENETMAATIRRQADRIAALEAEKEARERQAPVAWAWDDALGCMHAHCGSRRPVWVDGECSDAKRAETSLRPLYAAPPIPRVDPEWLANVIRTVDGNHSLGAGALAEKIAEAINARGGK